MFAGYKAKSSFVRFSSNESFDWSTNRHASLTFPRHVIARWLHACATERTPYLDQALDTETKNKRSKGRLKGTRRLR